MVKKVEKEEVSFDLVSKAVELVRKCGSTNFFWHQLGSDEELVRKVVALIDGRRVSISSLLPNLGRAIEVANYDYVDPHITPKNFPVMRHSSKMCWVELLRFGTDMTTSSVIKDMHKRGYEPARIEHLVGLDLDTNGRELQYAQFPVIALGSVWRDERGKQLVPCLHSYVSGSTVYDKALSLRSYREYSWKWTYQFIAVRVESKRKEVTTR